MEVEAKQTKTPSKAKRTLDRDADSLGTPVKKAKTGTPRKTPKKEVKDRKDIEVADLLIFGSGEQGNQLPPDLTKTVKFRRKPAPVSQFQDAKIAQVS